MCWNRLNRALQEATVVVVSQPQKEAELVEVQLVDEVLSLVQLMMTIPQRRSNTGGIDVVLILSSLLIISLRRSTRSALAFYELWCQGYQFRIEKSGKLSLFHFIPTVFDTMRDRKKTENCINARKLLRGVRATIDWFKRRALELSELRDGWYSPPFAYVRSRDAFSPYACGNERHIIIRVRVLRKRRPSHSW